MKRLLIIFCFLVTACGVKGVPEAPDTPPKLGRGQPTYQKATQEFAFPDLPPVAPDQDDESESEE